MIDFFSRVRTDKKHEQMIWKVYWRCSVLDFLWMEIAFISDWCVSLKMMKRISYIVKEFLSTTSDISITICNITFENLHHIFILYNKGLTVRIRYVSPSCRILILKSVGYTKPYQNVLIISRHLLSALCLLLRDYFRFNIDGNVITLSLRSCATILVPFALFCDILALLMTSNFSFETTH